MKKKLHVGHLYMLEEEDPAGAKLEKKQKEVSAKDITRRAKKVKKARSFLL